MSLANLSPHAALGVPYLSPEGREILLVLVKATFELAGEGPRLAKAQRPIRVNDVMTQPDAEQSSIRLPSDLVTQKSGADVVVVGSAISPEPVESLIVAVTVRDRVVRLRVHGERTYYRGAGGRIMIGRAAPFTEKPITYERAYGGRTADQGIIEWRNPVGRGVAWRDDDLVGQPAPQIELVDEPITGASDKPTPAGLGAIGTSWQPRAGYAGTFDDAWRTERAPLMPLDFDHRHGCCAHPSLQLDAPLQPGDPVSVAGMSAGQPLAFAIPAVPVTVSASYDDGSQKEHRPPLDTLVIEPRERRFELTCRVVLPLGRGERRLSAVRVE